MPAVQPAPLLVPSIAAPFAVPPSCASMIGENSIDVVGSPELLRSTDEACEECSQLTHHAMHFEYGPMPQVPFFRRSTATGFWQNLRRFVGLYGDERTLSRMDYFTAGDALGPLTVAVERAVRRSKVRGEDCTEILEIGSGTRRLAAGLRQLYKDQIRLVESSIRYATVLPEVFDEQLPEAGIDDALLPRDRFGLVYSYYGSMYGTYQCSILQKIVDSLKLGGEAMIMWERGRETNRMARLMRRYAAIFQGGGVDLSVESAYRGAIDSLAEGMHLIWARKRTNRVDLKALLRQAESQHIFEGIRPEPPQTMRLSSTGSYFPSRDIAPRHYEEIMKRMVFSAAAVMEIEPRRLAEKLLAGGPDYHAARAREDGAGLIASTIVHRYYLQDIEEEQPTRLEYHVPLSHIVAGVVRKAIPILHQETTVSREIGLMARHKAYLRR